MVPGQAAGARQGQPKVCHTRCVTLGTPTGRDVFVALQQEGPADSNWRISRRIVWKQNWFASYICVYIYMKLCLGMYLFLQVTLGDSMGTVHASVDFDVPETKVG